MDFQQHVTLSLTPFKETDAKFHTMLKAEEFKEAKCILLML